MSDSDLSDAPSAKVPSDPIIERNLRDEVRKAAKAHEEYTVKTIRGASEKSLGLHEGYYKSHATWNERSKTIIKMEAEKVSAADNESPEPQPVLTKSKASKAKAPAKKEPAPKRQPKRAAPAEIPRSRKKTKTASSEDDESSDESEAMSSAPSDFGSDSEAERVKKTSKKVPATGSKKQSATTKAKPKTKPKPKASASSELSDADSAASVSDKDSAPIKQGDGSDSEMSVVLDDAPAKKRSKNKDTSEAKPKASKTSKSKASEETDPDKEEIKKLQGWLVRCGVRKVWGKELKPYETSKAKIKHLEEMLSDIGMTGRFSNEKAASIKESRELAADIEAVQEGAQRWGKSGEEDGGEMDAENKTRSGRRIVRGSKNYAFLSSDGEETD